MHRMCHVLTKCIQGIVTLGQMRNGSCGRRLAVLIVAGLPVFFGFGWLKDAKDILDNFVFGLGDLLHFRLNNLGTHYTQSNRQDGNTSQSKNDTKRSSRRRGGAEITVAYSGKSHNGKIDAVNDGPTLKDKGMRNHRNAKIH